MQPVMGARCTCARSTAASSISPAIGRPFQPRTEHISQMHSARAVQCRLRLGCWIGTSVAHSRGTEPIGGKQESANGLITAPQRDATKGFLLLLERNLSRIYF